MERLLCWVVGFFSLIGACLLIEWGQYLEERRELELNRLWREQKAAFPESRGDAVAVATEAQESE